MNKPIRIELPTMYGMKTVNSWLFFDPEPVLIDCGEKSAASWEALNSGLADHGLRVEDIRKVIITHAHVDHMGMAAKITACSEAEIWCSDYVKPWAIDPEKMRQQRFHLIDEMMTKVSGKREEPIQLVFREIFGQISQAWDPVPADRIRIFSLEAPLRFGGGKWVLSTRRDIVSIKPAFITLFKNGFFQRICYSL